MEKEIVLQGQKCQNCGHEWFARVPKPKQCPRCKVYLKELEAKK